MKPEIRSCEDALRVLAAHLDDELGDGMGKEVEKHLSTCRSCYSRAEFERRLKQKIADSGRREVRAELKHRVQAILEQFAIASPDETSG